MMRPIINGIDLGNMALSWKRERGVEVPRAKAREF